MNKAEYQKKRRERLKAEGLCVDCGKGKAFSYLTRCRKCLDKKSIADKKHYQKNKERYRQRNIRYKKQLKEEDRCISCGYPLDGYALDIGNATCQNCSEKLYEGDSRIYHRHYWAWKEVQKEFKEAWDQLWNKKEE